MILQPYRGAAEERSDGGQREATFAFPKYHNPLQKEAAFNSEQRRRINTALWKEKEAFLFRLTRVRNHRRSSEDGAATCIQARFRGGVTRNKRRVLREEFAQRQRLRGRFLHALKRSGYENWALSAAEVRSRRQHVEQKIHHDLSRLNMQDETPEPSIQSNIHSVGSTTWGKLRDQAASSSTDPQCTSASIKVQSAWRRTLDVDLTELRRWRLKNVAACFIQALVRGVHCRRRPPRPTNRNTVKTTISK